MDKKIIKALPNSVHIHPILLALKNMPQDEVWVMKMLGNITRQVKATSMSNLLPRDILHALSFMVVYDSESLHVRRLALSLLDKFKLFDGESKKNVFLGASFRVDVVGGLVGIGMQEKDKLFTVSYLECVDVMLKATLTPTGATVRTMDNLVEILYQFQSMTFVEGTESGEHLTSICNSLHTELCRVQDDKVNIRQIAAALYGLQGLLTTPSPLGGEDLGPGAKMCVFLVEKLKKILTDDDTEINIFSCQLNAHLTLQLMVLFEFVSQNQLEALGMADNVAFIVSKLKKKMNTVGHMRKLFRDYASRCTLSESETDLYFFDQDINILHRHCFDVCIPAFYVVQEKSSDDNMDDKRTINSSSYCPDRESYNVDVVTPDPVSPHSRYLTELRDKYLVSKHNSTTIRCKADPSGDIDKQRATVLTALQDATLELIFPVIDNYTSPEDR